MLAFADILPRPARAFVGSTLTVGGAGLIGVPFGAIIGVPLLVVGTTLCVQGALVSVDDELSKTRRTVAEILLTLGALTLLLGCAMASVLMVEHLVALKRGQSPIIGGGIWAIIVVCVLAPALLTLGNLLRARAPSGETALRAMYWLLHVPSSAVAVMLYAAFGLTLTA